MTTQTASKSRLPFYALAFIAILGALGLGAAYIYFGHTEKMAEIAQKGNPVVASTTPAQPTQNATPAPAPTKVETPPATTPAAQPPASATQTTTNTKVEPPKQDKTTDATTRSAPTTKEPPAKEALPMKDKKLDIDAIVAKVTPVEVSIEEGEDVSFLMRACRPWSFWRNDISNVQELAIARALNGIEKEDNNLLPNKKGDKVKLPCEPTAQSKKWATCQLLKDKKKDLTVCNEAPR